MRGQLLVLFLLLLPLTFLNFIKAATFEPCSDMTKSIPYCKYGVRKYFEASIRTFDEGWSLSDVISDNNEKHYMLIKVPIKSTNSSKLVFQGNKRANTDFNQFLDVSIQDDCGGAPIEGESIRFLNSDAQILLTGWFVAKKPVCIGSFQISTQSYTTSRSVPFMVVLSPSAVVQSFVTFDTMIGFTIQSIDIDQTTGKRFIIMQKESQIFLVVYKDQIILKKQIASCEDPTACKVLSVHYSTTYEKLAVSFFEKKQYQLVIDGDMKDYSDYQSALWVVLLKPVDGTYFHSHRIFHSTTVVLQTPKIKFDSLGKLNSLLLCEGGCYLNGDAVSPNVFLLQYDYIKTIYSFTKNFISNPSGNFTFKIHSLSVERDNTITSVITGFDSVDYSIEDGNGRSMKAQTNAVYQYRFRHVDGKIIHIQYLTNEYDITDNFMVSISSPVVNTNKYVSEQNPIIYSRMSGASKELKAQSYLNYGNIYDNGFVGISQSRSFGGSGSNNLVSTSTRISSITVRFSANYITGFSFYRADGNGEWYAGNVDSYQIGITPDADEYITRIRHGYRKYGAFLFIPGTDTLACIRFETNKKSYGANGCEGGDYLDVPSELEITGFRTYSGSVVDSIYYEFGFATTYACASGLKGLACDVPTCYEIDSSSASVCNGKGQCTGPNTCSCSSSIGPSDSHTCLAYGFCEDISTFSSSSCHGRGICTSNSTCVCDRGYYGNMCETEAQCHGVPKNSYGVCSNHGSCLDIDTCECNTGYTGKNCESPICFGKTNNESTVCTGHGSCLRPNVCSCKTGYYGSKCQSFTCNGTDSATPSVCSGKGSCVDYNTCKCTEGYFGANCEQFTCNGTHYQDPTVCSGNGMCTKLDTCLCTTPKSKGTECELCESGYFGSKCEKWECFGLENQSPEVCSGRGVCKEVNTCVCASDTINGSMCESCITGYYGDKCGNWTCDGVPSTENSVCNFRGTCPSYNNCKCNTRSNGTFCDKCIDYYTGQSCSSCVGSHFGDECFNFLDSESAIYTEHETWYYESDYSKKFIWMAKLVGFKFSTNTDKKNTLGSIVDCSTMFENVDLLALASYDIYCFVTEQINPDKRSYKYNIEVLTYPERALFNPRDPISFNIFWTATDKPTKYIPIQLDVSAFLKANQPKFIGAEVANLELNRCSATTIQSYYQQPEQGSFQSLTWRLTGKSEALMKFKSMKDAIEGAQNQHYWEFPYVSEMLQYQTIDMSLSAVSFFGLSITRNYSFTLGASYPESRSTQYADVLLTSREAVIPLAQFFQIPNPECIDGRTMRYSSSSNVQSNFYSLSITKDSIIVKPNTFSTYFDVNIYLGNDATISISLRVIAPTVAIKESMVIYKPSIAPSITVTCKSYYGSDPLDIPQFVVVLEKGSVLRRVIVQDSEPFSLPVNTLYPSFNWTIDHTFTVACMSSYKYSQSSLSELGNILRLSYVGKSTQLVAFVPDNRVDVSSCKVVSATLKTKVGNLIPFSDNAMTYFLEISTTQAPNCKVDVVHVGSQYERRLIDSVFVSDSKYLVPLQYHNGNLKSSMTTLRGISKSFTLSLIGTSDVSDYTVQIEVQEPLSSSVKLDNCVVNPQTLEIGFTYANLYCNMENSISTLSMTLLQDDKSIGTSISFPIPFKATVSSSNFKILFTDMKTGGMSTMVVNLLNPLEFSTRNLFTPDTVSSLTTTLTTPSTDFYKNNDIVLSMVSNINTVSQNNSVLSEISKLIPLALAATTSSLSSQLDTSLSQGGVSSEDLSKYINQVKVLSNPQFLTDDGTSKTVDMLNKFVEVASMSSVWGSDSSSSLSDILINVATKIPEKSTIKLASSIVSAAISLGTKTELTTQDFFPTGKPSNLVSITAVKSLASSLNTNAFSFSNSSASLVSFNIVITSSIQIINIANTMFKFPTTIARKLADIKKEYVSQLILSSSMSGNVHMSIPIPSYSSPTSSRVKQTFRCSLTLDFIAFETESTCKFSKKSMEMLNDIKGFEQTLVVDCVCDLSSLSTISNKSSIIGITADYIEETLPYDEVVGNGNPVGGGGDSSGAAAVLLIPIFICCGCFILIPVIVVFIIVKEKRKNEPGVPPPRPIYERVVTSSTLSTLNSGVFYDKYGLPTTTSTTSGPTAPPEPYSVAMKTFNDFGVNEFGPSSDFAPTTI